MSWLALSLSLSLFSAVIASPTLARAQGNDFASPTGGRSTLMGGTGVALGRDGASPFLNPAGIVRIDDQRLAFSVNFYTLGLTHYGNLHQPGDVDKTQVSPPNSGGLGLTTNTFRVLPSTLCLFFTIKDLQKIAAPDSAPIPSDRVMRRKLAICFAQLEADDVSLDALRYEGTTADGTTSQVAAIAHRWSRTYIGPTYSSYLTDKLAIGASINGVYSHDAFAIDGSSVTSRVGGGAIGSSTSISGSGNSVDLTAIAGITYLASDTLTLGLSVRAPSLHVLGWYNGTSSQSTQGGTADSALVASGTGNFHAYSPLRVAGGIGFEWPKVKLEADAALILPLASAVSSTVDVTTSRATPTGVQQTQSTESYAVQSHPMLNPSLGLEYFVRKSFSLLGGVSTNLSLLSSLQPQPLVGNLAQAKINLATASFGIGSYGNGKELLFGGQFTYGWGDALVPNSYVIPNDWATVSTQSYAMMLVISGATDLRSIENAVTKVKNAVKTGDPNKATPTATPINPSDANPSKPKDDPNEEKPKTDAAGTSSPDPNAPNQAKPPKAEPAKPDDDKQH